MGGRGRATEIEVRILGDGEGLVSRVGLRRSGWVQKYAKGGGCRVVGGEWRGYLEPSLRGHAVKKASAELIHHTKAPHVC